MAANTFKIVRVYFDASIKRRTVETGLTLEEAQAHCQNPETSSTTCKSKTGKDRTRKLGPWFDGYERE